MVLSALGLVTAFFAYRMQELKKRQNLRLGLAGKLHDDIGANLSTIALKADMLSHAQVVDERRRTQLEDVGRLARDAAHKVRETVWVVNTQYDTVAGLVTKMRDTADVMLGGHVEFRFSSPDVLPERPIGMELRQNVYLVFKEALQNVIKHAQAKSVSIEVAYEHQILTMCVTDDGRGLPADMRGNGNGNGLGLMHLRALRHRGELTVSSPQGQGTRVSLRVRMK
jgi:signal transduction histidine kinase